MKGGNILMKWLKEKRTKIAVLFMTAIVCALSCVPVFADPAAGTANSDVTTAMTTVANDMIATGNAIVPIALGVVGIALVVVFGIRIFKMIVKK